MYRISIAGTTKIKKNKHINVIVKCKILNELPGVCISCIDGYSKIIDIKIDFEIKHGGTNYKRNYHGKVYASNYSFFKCCFPCLMCVNMNSYMYELKKH